MTTCLKDAPMPFCRPLRCLSLILAAAIGLFAALKSASAGEYNEVLSIGDKAPDWKDLPGVDGKKHSLADLSDKKVVVLVFTCVSCPTAADYEDRIQELTRHYAASKAAVAIVAVSVNRVEEDSLASLTKRAAEKGFLFTYIYDESQKIARDYGAIFTPEFFVLDRERKVAYMGAMDDATDPQAVKATYVRDAVDAVLAGTTPPVTETIARGCRVRYARDRRRE